MGMAATLRGSRALVLALVLAVAIVMQSMAVAHAACLSAATSDSLTPANAGISAWPSTSGPVMSAGCSEVVSVYTQGAYSKSLFAWPRTSCPHLASGLTPLETLYPSLVAGNNVVLNSGSYLLRQCSLPANAGILNRITVNAGATLVFDDSAISLHVREIYVAANASLLIGSETCRLYSAVTITFWGTAADSTAVDSPTGTTSKGLIAAGLVDVHGKQYHPTWTRLARTVQAGTSVLYLQDAVNWEVGQDVLITTSVLLDCPDSLYLTWCRPCYSWETCTPQKHQNEVRTITGLVMNDTTTTWAVSLSAPVSFRHYAGVEYQTEVALLSRRINFVGSQSNDNFGGHTKVESKWGRGRFSGVRADNMGQKNIVGRYPLHLHMMYDSDGAHASYFQDCVVTNSNFRGIVIHGTNGTRLSRNVAFNITGMTYYLEDGVEENNVLEYNLAAHVHPVKVPANGDGGQGGQTFLSSSDLFLPADTSASGFYVPNAYNTFIGNAASGGWSGFAFPNTPGPLGDFKGTLNADSPYNPYNRPLQKFVGNTAHSSGFYWSAHGSCMYVGAWLNYDTNGVMQYMSGREDRTTKWPNGTSSIMVFEHSKVWMCNKGISHWGNTVEIRNVEYHDIKVSSMLFGQAAIYNALINSATPNLQSRWMINRDKMGFQFYDTSVQSILVNVTFRNFSAATGYAIRYMDHSDHYTPQGINSVANIRFEQTDTAAILGIDNCGAPCGDVHTTMSSKIYSVWDIDGSFSRTGRPTLLGSNQKWWAFDDSCTYSDVWKVWMCDWQPRKTIGYVQLYIPGLMDGCDSSKFTTCTDQYAPNTVGRVSHWAKSVTSNYSLDLGPWPGVSGISNTGWYWRPKASDYGIDGAPSQFQVGDNFQLARGAFVVLAVAYPAGTTFRVYLTNKWWGYTYPDIAMTTKANVTAAREDLLDHTQYTCTGTAWQRMCTYTGGVGPAWHFDGTHLYIRLVSPACYNLNQKAACQAAYFESHGAKVWNVNGGFSYNVVATCPSCTTQSTLTSTKGTVTFWSTPDVAPATAFATDYGTVAVLGLPVNKALGAFTCPLPSASYSNTTSGSTVASGGAVASSTGRARANGTDSIDGLSGRSINAGARTASQAAVAAAMLVLASLAALVA